MVRLESSIGWSSEVVKNVRIVSDLEGMLPVNDLYFEEGLITIDVGLIS